MDLLRYILTFVLRAADFAVQVCLATGVGFEKVTAVGAENEGSNGGHYCGIWSYHVEEMLLVNMYVVVGS